MSGFWTHQACIETYFGRIIIRTDDVHYALLYPGERGLELLEDIEGKRTIEVGCGRGENSIALSKMGADAYGVDMSSAMLLKAREKSAHEKTSVRFYQMLAGHLGFLDGSFDAAVSAYVLDYVENPISVFAEVGRILKKGGIFVFSCCHPDQMPDTATPIGKRYYTKGEWPGTGRTLTNYYHPIDVMEQELERAGFATDRVIEAVTPNPSQITDFSPYPYVIEGLLPEFDQFSDKPHTVIFRATKN